MNERIEVMQSKGPLLDSAMTMEVPRCLDFYMVRPRDVRAYQ
jgi:hypothetical protein